MGSASAGGVSFPALATWLAARLEEEAGIAVTPVDIAAPARAGVGQSSDTWLFQARWAEHGQPRTADLVLRTQPGYDGIFLRPDAGREFTVIKGLARYPSVPVPRARWVERDPAVLGAPFFVMDQVPGIVPSGRPSIHVTGWLTTLTPGQRRSAWQSAIDAIAALHDVPWRRSHAFLAPGDSPATDAESGLAAYLRHMAEWYHWTAAGCVYPVTDAALAYLLEHAPGTTTAPPVLAWGDARPGNIIFDPRRCVPAALIDWEVATIAPPEADIAHWLVFDEFATSAAGVERLPGYATRDEIIGRYEAASGRRLGDVGYFETVQSFFLATTLIRQADARVKRGELPAGTRMGHDNTLTQMLARRLGLPVPELSEDYLSHRSGRRRPQPPAEPAAPAAPPGHGRTHIEGRLTVQDWNVFFLGGQWQPAAAEDRVEVVSPASLEVVGSVPRATKEDADRAIGAARAAFDTGPWPLRPAAERLGMLQALADAIEARTDQFADVLCAEQGLPRRGLPAGQISKAVATLRAGADIAGDYPWTGTRRGTGRRTLRVRRVPVGVVVAIIPWNAPLFVAAMKLAPALAAGNTVVLKPPPETPLHTYLLAEAALEAGLPAGVLNILPAGADISELLVRDPRVDKVSFTGSTAVGRQVGAICGESLKRCTLELGGKSAAVVLDDFELTGASARMLVTGAMVNAGQVCAAQTRILVPAARHDEIVSAMSEATRALRVGDPMSATTDIGPLISGRQRDRVERYIRLGVEEGASLVTGGGRPGIEPGWYVQPTLFAGVDNAMTIAREEIFGPVAAVIPYHDEAEAVALANDSEYGLAGAVWTADIGRGEAVAARIRTGSVAVNSPGALDAYGPFGGFKNSGFGREGGTEALDDYTECQTIILPAQAN